MFGIKSTSAIKTALRRRAAKVLLPLSTLQARHILRKRDSLRVLVDSSILAHGITHETAWISTGPKIWGDVEIQTGYAARIPVHSSKNDGRVYREVRYLAGIAHLARSGLLQLYSSAELNAEQFRQPLGRFRGYGYGDFNVFEDVKIESIDGFHLDIFCPEDTQLRRVASCTDPLFQSLLKTLGPKSSLDAYHVFTAEKFGLYAFLHIDFPLAEKMRQNLNRAPVQSLKTKVLLPSEFAQLIRLLPVDTNLLTLAKEDDFFPTRPELHWDAQRRQRPRKTAP